MCGVDGYLDDGEQGLFVVAHDAHGLLTAAPHDTIHTCIHQAGKIFVAGVDGNKVQIVFNTASRSNPLSL